MKRRAFLAVAAAGLLAGCASQTSAPSEQRDPEPASATEPVTETATGPRPQRLTVLLPIPRECEENPRSRECAEQMARAKKRFPPSASAGEPEPDCSRQFDQHDAGFQTCLPEKD